MDWAPTSRTSAAVNTTSRASEGPAPTLGVSAPSSWTTGGGGTCDQLTPGGADQHRRPRATPSGAPPRIAHSAITLLSTPLSATTRTRTTCTPEAVLRQTPTYPSGGLYYSSPRRAEPPSATWRRATRPGRGLLNNQGTESPAARRRAALATSGSPHVGPVTAMPLVRRHLLMDWAQGTPSMPRSRRQPQGSRNEVTVQLPRTAVTPHTAYIYSVPTTQDRHRGPLTDVDAPPEATPRPHDASLVDYEGHRRRRRCHLVYGTWPPRKGRTSSLDAPQFP